MTADWRDFANCRDVDPSFFFASEGEDYETRRARLRIAKGICAECTVAKECDEYATTTNTAYGVWGGKDEKERQRGDMVLGCKHCSKRFVWSWAPTGKPWYCSDSCRRAAQKLAHRLRNKKYQEISA